MIQHAKHSFDLFRRDNRKCEPPLCQKDTLEQLKHYHSWHMFGFCIEALLRNHLSEYQRFRSSRMACVYYKRWSFTASTALHVLNINMWTSAYSRSIKRFQNFDPKVPRATDSIAPSNTLFSSELVLESTFL